MRVWFLLDWMIYLCRFYHSFNLVVAQRRPYSLVTFPVPKMLKIGSYLRNLTEYVPIGMVTTFFYEADRESWHLLGSKLSYPQFLLMVNYGKWICTWEWEIRAGRLNFHVVTRSLQLNEWKHLKFMIFDAPKYPGKFTDRLRYLEKTIRRSPNVQLADQTECRSRSHLLEVMEGLFLIYLFMTHPITDTIANGGEGLIIRKPDSSYVVGRSPFSQKVKVMVFMLLGY